MVIKMSKNQKTHYFISIKQYFLFIFYIFESVLSVLLDFSFTVFVALLKYSIQVLLPQWAKSKQAHLHRAASSKSVARVESVSCRCCCLCWRSSPTHRKHLALSARGSLCVTELTPPGARARARAGNAKRKRWCSGSAYSTPKLYWPAAFAATRPPSFLRASCRGL